MQISSRLPNKGPPTECGHPITPYSDQQAGWAFLFQARDSSETLSILLPFQKSRSWSWMMVTLPKIDHYYYAPRRYEYLCGARIRSILLLIRPWPFVPYCPLHGNIAKCEAIAAGKIIPQFWCCSEEDGYFHEQSKVCAPTIRGYGPWL